ncbi:lipid transfer-like protein VAS [Hordeum vulgare]|nr:lipid transfer-like protein VAS [Hordeum vulgare]
MLLVASVLVAGAATQSSGMPEGASKLVGCARSLNGTVAQMPSETCCSLLREAVKNGQVGLCALYASSEIFKAFNINGTDALRLFKRCGVTEDISSCPSNSPVMELADIAVWDNKRARITPRHIQLAVRNDYELAHVLESVLISGSGVRPDIYTELLHNMVKAKGSA